MNALREAYLTAVKASSKPQKQLVSKSAIGPDVVALRDASGNVIGSPERKVWVYAETQDEATKKLHSRMNENYKGTWQLTWKVVRSYSPGQMAMQTSGNFLSSLTKSDALEFLEHYNSNERGIDLPKDVPPDRVRRDVRDFEKWIKTDRR